MIPWLFSAPYPRASPHAESGDPIVTTLILAATSFAEATVVKKNAKGAKELGGGVYTPYTAK